MAKLKRLSESTDNVVFVPVPISKLEISQRAADYPVLTPSRFTKKFNHLFDPVEMDFNGKVHTIQMNHCDNPFCKWYGLSQEKFYAAKGNPSRYRISGTTKNRSQSIACNPDPSNSTVGITLNCFTTPYSNWSIAEEIKRLATIDRVFDIEVDYEFHRDDCPNSSSTPFVDKNAFYKRGKSSGHSQKWQCKTCRKITNVLPTREQSMRYHQKRNDIIVRFANALLNRTPVTRTCEMLGIGAKTYYGKLEWVYRRCLEFLERYEKKRFENLSFDSVWLNTDKLIYYLNNVRKKGQGGRRYEDIEDSQFPTHIIVTGDVSSNYIFRADVAYDWDVSLNDISTDTQMYFEDHLHDFNRKNARLRFSYEPQPPTKNDPQTKSEYFSKLSEYQRRGKYTDGLHTNSTYTSIAHLWLIKQMVKTKQWRMVTDEDNSLLPALYRVFSREISLTDAHHFLCKVDRTKTTKDAYQEYVEGREDLIAWGQANGYDRASARKLAFLLLREQLKTHKFYKVVIANGKAYPLWGNNPIEPPLPTVDKGYYTVDCTTDVSSLDDDHLTNMILKVSDRPTNNFMQQIRRRLSILERPLVTARKDGKSYIYANFNPKYAQMAITILRTYYNFCLTMKVGKENLTPAQQIGLIEKQFTINDILYFK